MNPQRNEEPTAYNSPAENAISHDEANFAETPTARRAINQLHVIVGFLVAIAVGVLALWIVSSLDWSQVEETPNPMEEVR